MIINKKANKNQLQQGDVCLEKINCNLENLKGLKKEKKTNGYILAYGEATGHMHKIEESEKVELYEYLDDYLEEKCMLLRVLRDKVQLKHEEHGNLVLEKGDYRVTRVNEFDPFEEEIRKVQD